MMTELRKLAPNPDYPRIYEQARHQVISTYYGEVRKMIEAWRKKRFVLAAWTTEEDDVTAVNNGCRRVRPSVE